MRISDWSSDVCSSDLRRAGRRAHTHRDVQRRPSGGRPERPDRDAERAGELAYRTKWSQRAKVMRKPLLLLSLGAAGLLFAGADAQVLKNHDSNAPVNFTADRIEVQDRADRVVESGNVEVTQAGIDRTSVGEGKVV